MALSKMLEHQIRGGRLVDPRNNRDGSISFSRPGGGKKVTYSAYELGRTPTGGQKQMGYLPNAQTQGQLGAAIDGRAPGALGAVAGSVGGLFNRDYANTGAQQVDGRRFGGLQTSTPIEGINSSLPRALGMGAPQGWRNSPSPSQIYQQALSMQQQGMGNDHSGIPKLGHEGNPYYGHGNMAGLWDTMRGRVDMRNPYAGDVAAMQGQMGGGGGFDGLNGIGDSIKGWGGKIGGWLGGMGNSFMDMKVGGMMGDGTKSVRESLGFGGNDTTPDLTDSVSSNDYIYEPR